MRSERVEGKEGIRGMWIVPARSPIVRVSIGREVVMAEGPWVDLKAVGVSEEPRGAIEGGIVGSGEWRAMSVQYVNGADNDGLSPIRFEPMSRL